jgi:hypothetical protein
MILGFYPGVLGADAYARTGLGFFLLEKWNYALNNLYTCKYHRLSVDKKVNALTWGSECSWYQACSYLA